MPVPRLRDMCANKYDDMDYLKMDMTTSNNSKMIHSWKELYYNCTAKNISRGKTERDSPKLKDVTHRSIYDIDTGEYLEFFVPVSKNLNHGSDNA